MDTFTKLEFITGQHTVVWNQHVLVDKSLYGSDNTLACQLIQLALLTVVEVSSA